MEGTLRTALALLPDTRHAALIGGASVEDQGFNALGRQAVQHFGDRLRLIDLAGLPIDEMLARLSVLPETTIVLASSIRGDRAGRRFYRVEVAGPLSTTANRPLFTVFGTVMGLGIVGGSMIDFEAVGREAGELTLRTLRGEPMPSASLRSGASNMPLFDWRELRRWSLDKRRLPAGSRVLYRQPSLWEQYRWHIAVTNAQAAHRFLAATPADLDELRDCLEDIVKNDRRAGEVIRRMRRLLQKGGPAELLPLNLNDLAQNVLALVSNDALLHQVSIETVPAPALPVVYGDGIQIQQVILNLHVNAITAAATGPPADRKVTVWTAAGDAHAELSVHDSGKGMSETDLDRVFEPFFTTKPEGLGMGLAISRSIVQAHHGRIWGENDPAGGAIFRVRLPTSPGAAVRAVSGK